MSPIFVTAGLAAGAILTVAVLRLALQAALVACAFASEVAAGPPRAASPPAEIIPFPVGRERVSAGRRAAA